MLISTDFLIEEEEPIVDFGEDTSPKPTSTDSNITSTFESGNTNNKTTIKRTPFKKYYVKVLTNDQDVSLTSKRYSSKQQTNYNKQYKEYMDKLEDYNSQKKKDTLKTFFSFKHLNYLPSSYKVMADKLETYFTDTFQSD